MHTPVPNTTTHIFPPGCFQAAFKHFAASARYCFCIFFALDILAEEVTPELLDGVAAVHLDSRHTPAAIALAKLANER